MTSGLDSSEPITLPPESGARSTWYGTEIVRREDWMAHVSAAEIAELERAIQKFDSWTDDDARLDLTSMVAKDVPLPALAPRLHAMLDEVLNGRGFVLIRSLPVQRWTRRQAAIAFLAIGVHLGNLRMQNAQGHILGHVRDLGEASEDPNIRIYQTRERQTHHTDSCDVVALMCLQKAKSGGLSSIVSSTTIFK